MIKAKETLQCIKEGVYNLTRPDSLIIAELVEVINYLNRKIEKLEKR